MKNILCFGDSNTWGFNADTFQRFPFDTRWTGVLQLELGNDYRVNEEGLNGRTTVYDDVFNPSRAGNQTLPMILETHTPIDMVILMLGTNDLQMHRRTTARNAARGCGSCIKQILFSGSGPEAGAPQILLIAPPPFKQPSGFMDVIFGDNIDVNTEESKKLAAYCQTVANIFNTLFLDAGSVIESSSVDGIHFDADQHLILGKHIAEIVKSQFSK